MKHLNIDELFNEMWHDYCRMNPQAQSVYDKLTGYGEDVINDHIAFRTFSHPKVCIEVLAKPFLERGYHLAGEYRFESKKLRAKHFEHSDPNRPKVFISELDLSLMQPETKKLFEDLTHQFGSHAPSNERFLFSGRPWTANYKKYLKLAEESEYAAWLYAHGYRPNHFTVYINYLKKLNSINDLNGFLKQNGFALNAAGGEIKGSAGEHLEQSSTLANEVMVHFEDGSHRIPGCYYEFAKRYPLKDGKLFQGFIGKSADKIFESTDRQKH